MTDRNQTDRSPNISVGSCFGWALLAVGTLIWVLILPISALSVAFSEADPSKLESGFATTGITLFGILGGIGFSCLSYSLGNKHTATRVALWLYLPLLAVGIAIAVAMHIVTR